jgi:hypothetical protein
LKPPIRKHNEKGQALLLAVAAIGILLIGAVGFAVDGGNMYLNRVMAQAAADAGAQAGIMSMFAGTNGTSANPFSTSSTFNCTTTDLRTPCVYAAKNGVGGTAADTVTVDFPATSVAPGVNFATGADTIIRVTVTRNIDTTLMRLLGTNTATVKAVAIAAIVSVVAPVPILVTHPTLSGALSSNGNPTIAICGGPSRSIQVNSSSATSLAMGNNTTIDLSHAGPLDSLVSPCTTGTGADFGDFGGPSTNNFTFTAGSKPGKFLQPASPIRDPLASVPAPGDAGGQAIPAAAPVTTPLANGVGGCPASPPKACNLWSPGRYPTGIDVKNETAVFKPGLYYIDNGGFTNSANGVMVMATGVAADATTGSGMVVYNAGTGTFKVGSNSEANLVGSDAGSIYKGILFFESRTAPANTGVNAHRFGGGGSVTLKGTIYISNSLAVMNATPAQYQEVKLQGTPGSSTQIIGEIIVSALSLGGNAGITMQLDPAATLVVRQVALVR